MTVFRETGKFGPLNLWVFKKLVKFYSFPSFKHTSIELQSAVAVLSITVLLSRELLLQVDINNKSTYNNKIVCTL